MPLDELLALYGYEASDPISERESEGGDSAPNLPDMTLDKVSEGPSQNWPQQRGDSHLAPECLHVGVRRGGPMPTGRHSQQA